MCPLDRARNPLRAGQFTPGLWERVWKRPASDSADGVEVTLANVGGHHRAQQAWSTVKRGGRVSLSVLSCPLLLLDLSRVLGLRW